MLDFFSPGTPFSNWTVGDGPPTPSSMCRLQYIVMLFIQFLYQLDNEPVLLILHVYWYTHTIRLNSCIYFFLYFFPVWIYHVRFRDIFEDLFYDCSLQFSSIMPFHDCLRRECWRGGGKGLGDCHVQEEKEKR